MLEHKAVEDIDAARLHRYAVATATAQILKCQPFLERKR